MLIAKDDDMADEEIKNQPVENDPTKEVEEQVKGAIETTKGTNETSKLEEVPAQPITDQGLPAKKPHKLKAFLTSKPGIVLMVLAGLAIIIGTLFSIPTTRYAIAGLVVKKDVGVIVLDQATNKPISEAEVKLAGKTTKTDAEGKAQFKQIPVGPYHLHVTKKYYKDTGQDITVPILSAPANLQLQLEATGRQVPVKVINKVTQKPLEKATISASETTTVTDANGEATIVLPADKQAVDGAIKLDGYNDQTVSIVVTEQKDDKNTFSLTPSGKLYFLSKRTGKISVMKSDLDGSNTEIVVAGTGKEEEYGTVLLAARDWRYLALKARRDGDKPKLYLIDTNTSKLTVIDEGDAEFAPVGWYNHRFIFTVTRNKAEFWQPKRQALKVYNAETNKLATLDETAGEGTASFDYAYEILNNAYILEDQIIYTKHWNFIGHNMTGKRMGIYSVKPDGSNKKTVKDFEDTKFGYYINDVRLYKPQELYFSIFQDSKESFWEFEDGKVGETKDVTKDSFYKSYPTFLLSPSGKNTFWYESRDGKNILFIGDAKGEQAKEIASLSEYSPYGWYGDGYILLSKKGSELYIAPAGEAITDKNIFKVTDYHRPASSFYGYGYGYGGI